VLSTFEMLESFHILNRTIHRHYPDLNAHVGYDCATLAGLNFSPADNETKTDVKEVSGCGMR